jgi:prepilin-type N-terminal cleavage/methylation domain-containing protein
MPTKTPSHNGIRAISSGFTLVEMAVVIVVMGILLTMGLRMTQATQNNAAWAETKLKQDRIKVALISFMRTNGRLPCPDAALPPTGAEPANCLVNAGRGVLPWRVLGLSVNDVQDGWSNFFTYRVANSTPAGRNWTTRVGATAFTITEMTAPSPALTVQERPTPGGALNLAISPNPVVVILSHGQNGLGARTIRGAALLPAPPAGDENTNAGAGSTNFVIRTPSDVAGANGAYDDIVAYLTPNDLLQPLLDDKTLKGVATSYRDLAMIQLGVASCTPQPVGVAQPLIDAIIPTIGNGAITYSCQPGDSCSPPAAPVQSSVTLGTKILYRLSLFGAAPQPVTYAQLQAAYPAIQTRCP